MTSPTEISARYDLTNGIFNAIAQSYDRTNGILSFGFNAMWHRRMIREVGKVPHQKILDLACGTGTLTKKLARLQYAQTTARDRDSLQNAQITGVDPSANMLSVAKKRLGKKGNVTFVKGYAESLPFSEGSFAVVTVSYGIRNFADPEASLQEIKRVLQPGGRLFILEFSPEKGDSPAHVIKRYYIHKILPRIGWISTGQRQAYEYLRDSVESFPQAAVICSKMEDAGFTEVSHTRLKPGVAVLFTGVKLR
ncbi:MAG: bifunctional demethylmenaquinone methyltransferase/2-methoxy-6-polyprenyl-1,4-benzoquinol methylase UbiE [Bacteroidales bacterium]|jgi:demethylmenaquinone methyltransferase/2-methoxy-6-polyprenyl-1,4-benzoquinol methylase|nr:bifunctional demethylmenaquinone methyltransferase/2-methoxy-6-polyprenyl-1,4-benzoquinol methylase UbiE [Bacteroidales bacterium]MDD3105532.1 bifunctional demethylmenaquinone methyltransferase/2-methoxy-6-polyprenyl-1,4-benzoquinol methylase UbiE [Bacteroidales bacterium]MDD3550092.1 bifunctional demethylmenaquinone methyltransferase/2-methoxy-6-polyprenyl-1,4-benzoquinol methylase UbiE [Bacteroidales bacterium]MDD4064817.1 bifunctional demethylmenaquinone methyltransferase/2-methoxy-6-polyp